MKGLAISKRIKISKTQQQMLLAVLGAALIVGVSLVLLVYCLKGIDFNKRVIIEKDKAILSYEAVISNVGICKDEDGDKKFSEEELKRCNPDAIDVQTIKGTLRYNVMEKMAKSADLELVGRASLKGCYDENKERRDFNKEYEKAETDVERNYALDMLRMCSALRVIPEALPAKQNDEALMSSLNQLFIISKWEPEAISPSGGISKKDKSGLGTIPVSLSVEGTTDVTRKVLTNIERSIRLYDINTATISWSGVNKLILKAQATSYYTEEKRVEEKNNTVYASDKAKNDKKTGNGRKKR